jgi:hypothetical protein
MPPGNEILGKKFGMKAPMARKKASDILMPLYTSISIQMRRNRTKE